MFFLGFQNFQKVIFWKWTKKMSKIWGFIFSKFWKMFSHKLFFIKNNLDELRHNRFLKIIFEKYFSFLIFGHFLKKKNVQFWKPKILFGFFLFFFWKYKKYIKNNIVNNVLLILCLIFLYFLNKIIKSVTIVHICFE